MKNNIQTFKNVQENVNLKIRNLRLDIGVFFLSLKLLLKNQFSHTKSKMLYQTLKITVNGPAQVIHDRSAIYWSFQLSP